MSLHYVMGHYLYVTVNVNLFTGRIPSMSLLILMIIPTPRQEILLRAMYRMLPILKMEDSCKANFKRPFSPAP